MNELKQKKLINDWVLGGGIASKFYCNPPATKDIDFFISTDDMSLSAMNPIQEYLIENGGTRYGHMINMHGIIVDLIITDAPMILEGMKYAVNGKVEGVMMRVLPADYLAAIATKVNRLKDIERVIALFKAGVLSSYYWELLRRFEIAAPKIIRELL